MAAGTVPILMAQPSQVPAGSKRAGGSREGATAVKFEDVLRELDRSGEPAARTARRPAGSSAKGASSGIEAAPGESGAKASADEKQDGATEGAEGSGPLRLELAYETALATAEAAAPAAPVEPDAAGAASEPQALPVATVPGDGSGAAQVLAGGLEPGVPGAGPAVMMAGPDGAQVLPSLPDGEVLAPARAPEAGPVVEVPGQTTEIPVVQGSMPGLEAAGSTAAQEAVPGLFEDLFPKREGRATARPAGPSTGEPGLARESGPGELARAVLQELAGRQQAGATAPSSAPHGAREAGDLLPEGLEQFQGQTENRAQGSSGLARQGEVGGTSGFEARTTWSQLLEEMGLRFEAEGEPGRHAVDRAEAQPAAKPVAKGGPSALPAYADGEPAPTQVQGTLAAQVPAGPEATAQPAVTAADAASGTSRSAAPSRSDGAVTTPFAQVGDVVVKRLQQLRSPGSDELRLELEPKELGSLKIRLELRGDGVKAHFVVDRPVVQVMLDRAMAELRQALVNQGYQVEELQVALQGDEGQGRESFGERQNRAGRSRGLRVGEVESAASPEAGVSRRMASVGPGRIDIRV